MTLKQQLDEMRKDSAEKIPAKAKAIMSRVQNELRDSGVLDHAIKPGAAAPAFSLPDADENIVTLDGLLKQGWLILSFYRGVW